MGFGLKPIHVTGQVYLNYHNNQWNVAKLKDLLDNQFT
jgi:hypothetical protein